MGTINTGYDVNEATITSGMYLVTNEPINKIDDSNDYFLLASFRCSGYGAQIAISIQTPGKAYIRNLVYVTEIYWGEWKRISIVG